MRVLELQQFIRSLLPPLTTAGASQKVIGELESASKNLEPFRDQTIEAFADFLGRAEVYERTGVIPFSGKAAPKSSPKKSEALSLTRDQALTFVRDLYERSTNDNVSYTLIDNELKQLDSMKKPDLDHLTAQFGLGKHKSKAAALDAIREKITDFKATNLRTRF